MDPGAPSQVHTRGRSIGADPYAASGCGAMQNSPGSELSVQPRQVSKSFYSNPERDIPSTPKPGSSSDTRHFSR
jgi:hypothetical protein